jgi:hypothetical protein
MTRTLIFRFKNVAELATNHGARGFFDHRNR